MELYDVGKMNEILVFKAGSKRKDFTIRSVFPKEGVEQLARVLGAEEAKSAKDAFSSLKRLGGEYLVFRQNGRKIKVQIAA